MVNSVGNTPYSYLDQLLGKTAATPAIPSSVATPSSDDSSNTAATSAAANAFGLPPEVIALLQSVGGDTTISSLLGGNNSSSSDNSITGLIGGSVPLSAKDILINMENGVLETKASSGLYQAALNGAISKKSAASLAGNNMDKILATYNATINQTAQPAITVDTIVR